MMRVVTRPSWNHFNRHRVQIASSPILPNTPAVIHSSRRDRTVVSDTSLPHSRSASSHEHPVANRTRITAKHARSDDRWR